MPLAAGMIKITITMVMATIHTYGGGGGGGGVIGIDGGINVNST